MKMRRSSVLAEGLVVFSFLLLSTPVSCASSIEDGAQFSRAPVDYPYKNYTEIKVVLLSLQSSYPEILQVIDIGDSWEKQSGLADRDILAVKISDNVGLEESEPEVLIMALHHAREWTTSEIALSLAENLTAAYGSDPRVSWLIDNREIWIVPVVNPDGLDYALDTDEWWRKNRRLNYDGSYGVDLNRNYNGSEDGNPSGAWGGVGSSPFPGDDTYRGQSSFSEPETQAVRDLIYAHDFQIGIDFHSYGDWVLWPWGYTLSPAADDVDLTRIGTEFAALNGYVPLQSSETYPTTGDSVDWMYGGAGIYSYCIEVGGNSDGFHPTRAQDVTSIIDENTPVALAAIEKAGDRQEQPFDISHVPSGEWNYISTGLQVNATITADRGIDTSALRLIYRTSTGTWAEVPMVQGAQNDTYVGVIPAVDPGVQVEYYIVARDLGSVLKMSPMYAPYDSYSTVAVDRDPPLADAGNGISTVSGEVVTFDGTASVDNHGIANYTWMFTHNGSQVVLYGPTPEFQFWTPGDYAVTLTVNDSSNNLASDSVTVVVYDGSIPEFGMSPLAIAGAVLVFLTLLIVRRRHRG